VIPLFPVEGRQTSLWFPLLNNLPVALDKKLLISLTLGALRELGVLPAVAGRWLGPLKL